MKRNYAFTLAEVLITLGVIGVVAALTIPSLIQNYKKHVVETRLKNFYTTMNQAIKMSEPEFGDFQNWEFGRSITVYDKYLKPYLKLAKIEYKDNRNYYYLMDGSGYYPRFPYTNDRPWELELAYCPFGFSNCDTTGVNKFFFVVNTPKGAYGNGDGRLLSDFKNPIEPYTYGWSWSGKKITVLYSDSTYGCANGGGHYCCAIIMLNNWKIPKDYPFKF